VVLQGVLGGLRVVLFKDQIGIFHAMLAQLFFALLCALALFTSPWWSRTQSPKSTDPQTRFPSRSLCYLFGGATLLIFGQLILGASMRHQHAGLAIPDFPLAYGKVWPAMDRASVAFYNQRRLEITAQNPITSPQILLQLAHRLVAMLVLAAVGLCAWRARRELGSKHLLTHIARWWLGLILAQVLLGAATIWSNKAADVATAHVATGALSLALGVIGSIVLLRFSSFEAVPEASGSMGVAAMAKRLNPQPAAASPVD
jgi:cytochrome c oxidase assembly protein subunit 15